MADSSYSVVHLTMRFDSTNLSTGSGILYLYKDKFYIVTAWHNLSGRHSENLTIQNKEKAPPNNVVALITREFHGLGGARIPITIPLASDDETFYYVHPVNYPRIDVAIIPLDIDALYETDIRLGDGSRRKARSSLMQSGEFPSELCPLQKYEINNPEILKACMEDIDVTDELFIPGYPENVTDYAGNPVWKRATVASSVLHGWNREPKFLIDSASRPGMSGAPVFYYSKTGKITTRRGTIVSGKAFVIFLGIYVGRMPSQDKDDAQIGVVWKREVVEEIIEGKRYDIHSSLLEAGPKEVREAVLDTLSRYTEKGISLILDENADYRYYARNVAHKLLEGRASFQDILDCVMEETPRYKGPYAVETES